MQFDESPIHRFASVHHQDVPILHLCIVSSWQMVQKKSILQPPFYLCPSPSSVTYFPASEIHLCSETWHALIDLNRLKLTTSIFVSQTTTVKYPIFPPPNNVMPKSLVPSPRMVFCLSSFFCLTPLTLQSTACSLSKSIVWNNPRQF